MRGRPGAPVRLPAGALCLAEIAWRHPLAMVDPSSTLIRVSALCAMLRDALDELDGGFASEGFLVELRRVCLAAHDELERRIQAPTSQ